MNTSPRTFPNRWCRVTILVVLAGTLLALAATAPAFAADGVRVLPAPSPSPTDPLTAGVLNEYSADVAGSFVAYLEGSINPPNDWNAVALKSLDDDREPFLPYWDWAWSTSGPTFGPLTQAHPSIAVSGGTVYVVWMQLDQTEPFDSDIWIWEGSYDPGTGDWTPTNATFPKLLAGEGFAGAVTAPVIQRNPDVGVVHESDGDHVIVAWEDTRDNGYDAALVYMLDLTGDTLYQSAAWPITGAPTAGVAVDQTPVWARGQRQPDVGYSGIYWLDERYSLWSESGNLTNTSIWRCDLNTGSPASGALWHDTHAGYDNGEDWSSELGPVTTARGAAWMRRGPYFDPDVWRPFTVNAGSSVGSTVAAGAQPVGIDADYVPGGTATGYVWIDRHLGDPALDFDVFFCGGPGRSVVPVCNVGWPSGTVLTEEATPQWWRRTQTGPAIGTAPGGYRVVWSDARDSIGVGDEDNADMRLYEAFVPTISLSVRTASILWTARFRFTAGVAPDFTGEPVSVQRLMRVPNKLLGGVSYVPIRGATVKKTLGDTSTVSWSWKAPAKGTYYFRVWFAGATKYNADGVGTSDKQRLVPHVGNYSQVVKVVAK